MDLDWMMVDVSLMGVYSSLGKRRPSRGSRGSMLNGNMLVCAWAGAGTNCLLYYRGCRLATYRTYAVSEGKSWDYVGAVGWQLTGLT